LDPNPKKGNSDPQLWLKTVLSELQYFLGDGSETLYRKYAKPYLSWANWPLCEKAGRGKIRGRYAVSLREKLDKQPLKLILCTVTYK
jgi:hypothetical protein